MEVFFYISLAILAFPLAFVMPKANRLNKRQFIIYATILIIALSFLIVDNFVSKNNNQFFIIMILILGVVNLGRLIQKRLV